MAQLFQCCSYLCKMGCSVAENTILFVQLRLKKFYCHRQFIWLSVPFAFYLLST